MKNVKTLLIALFALGNFYSVASFAGSSFTSVGVNVFGIGVQVASGSSSYTPPPPYYYGGGGCSTGTCGGYAPMPVYSTGGCGTGVCGSHGYVAPVPTCGQPRPVCASAACSPCGGAGMCGGSYYPYYPAQYGSRSFTAVNVSIAPFRRLVPVRRGFMPVRRMAHMRPMMRRHF